jgi:hypothetical protein
LAVHAVAALIIVAGSAWAAPPPVVAEGRWRVSADGPAVVFEDTAGTARRVLPGRDLAGRLEGPPEAIVPLPGRRSVLVTWPALGEWWEVSLDPAAPPVLDGFVHDYRTGEAIPKPGFLTPRRIPLPGPWTRFAWTDPRVAWLGAWREGRVVIVHLEVRRAIADFEAPGADVAAARLGDDGVWRVPARGGELAVDTRLWVRLAP